MPFTDLIFANAILLIVFMLALAMPEKLLMLPVVGAESIFITNGVPLKQ